MGVASSARLLGAGIAWRRLGVTAAGRTLAHALGGDEQDRTVAGIGLVRAGVRSVRVLDAEYEERGATTMMVRVLADIGGEEARHVLGRIACEDADVAKDAAKDAAGDARRDAATLARRLLDGPDPR
jgi:hypothetical protein